MDGCALPSLNSVHANSQRLQPTQRVGCAITIPLAFATNTWRALVCAGTAVAAGAAAVAVAVAGGWAVAVAVAVAGGWAVAVAGTVGGAVAVGEG